MVEKYQLEILPEAISDLKKLDKVISQRIFDKIRWLSENFEDIVPQMLTSEFKGMYKLRVGDWRIIYTVNQNTKIITVHMVGHRSEIYKT